MGSRGSGYEKENVVFDINKKDIPWGAIKDYNVKFYQEDSLSKEGEFKPYPNHPEYGEIREQGYLNGHNIQILGDVGMFPNYSFVDNSVRESFQGDLDPFEMNHFSSYEEAYEAARQFTNEFNKQHNILAVGNKLQKKSQESNKEHQQKVKERQTLKEMGISGMESSKLTRTVNKNGDVTYKNPNNGRIVAKLYANGKRDVNQEQLLKFRYSSK